MKKIYITILIALITANFFAQTPNWTWAKNAGGSINSIGTSVANDQNGNVIITGGFVVPSLTFGSNTITNEGNSGNFSDMYIVKYNAFGSVLWAKSVGGSADELGTSVCTDNTGNIYVTGYFTSPTITVDTITLTNSGNMSIFILKYSASGILLWARTATGNFIDSGNSITTDNNGNVIVTGSFSSSTITFGTTILTNVNVSDVFIVKYNTSGAVLWAKSAGGVSSDEGFCVSSDSNGNIFLTGVSNSGSITFGSITLSNSTSQGIFIVKYDASGNVLWAKTGVGFFDSLSMRVSTDANGNAFVTGSFVTSTITFGATTLMNSGIRNFFIVKYNSSGNLLWAKAIGGAAYDEVNSVSADSSGNAYVTGAFSSPTITFDSITLTNTNFLDIFIAKYDASGNALWAQSVGGTNNDIAFDISNDGSGNVFVTGVFESPTLTFGTTTLNKPNGSGSVAHIFTAKLNGTSLGITDHGNNHSFSIAPNPFSSSTFILFREEQKNTTITITDVAGRLVKTVNFSGIQYEIMKENLENGIYFIHTHEKNNIITNTKIVIQ